MKGEHPYKIESRNVILGIKFILLINYKKAFKEKNSEGQGLCYEKCSQLEKELKR